MSKQQANAAFGACIYLWCYPDGSKHYAGWHLTADARGCAALIGAIDELHSGAQSSRSLRTLPVTASVLRVHGKHWKPRSAARLIVEVLKDAEHADTWMIAADDATVSLALGSNRVDSFRAAIDEVARGKGDFSLGPVGKRAARDQFVWFWSLLPEDSLPR